MKKLLLEEDEVIVEPVVDGIQMGNLISQMIRSEWDSVDLYNSMLLTLEEQHQDELAGILNTIITDHYANIGQLEKALQILNSQAQNIELGKEEAEEVLES